MQDPSSANAIMTKPLLGFIHCLLAVDKATASRVISGVISGV